MKPFERQLERLLSEAADEGFTPERVAAVEALLRDHPEAMPLYEHWMTLQVTLQTEFSLSGSDFPSSGASPDAIAQLADSTSRSATQSGGRFAGKWMAPMLLAASLLVALTTAGILLVRSDSDRRIADAGELASSGASDDSQTSRLRQPWPQLRLASLKATDASPLASISAPVWLERFNTYPARGFVVPVNPGCRIEAYVDASAEGANQLAILEIDELGQPLRQAILFSNDEASGSEAARSGKRFGRLGRWTDENTTSERRYFLLAGLHRLHDAPADRTWRVSDFAVLIREPHLVHIGWDDSGVHADETWPEVGPARPSDYQADYDFDDMSVSIRIIDPSEMPKRSEPAPRTFPPSHALGELPPESEAVHPLVVEPGEAVIVRAISGVTSDCRVAVANAETREVLWSLDNRSMAIDARGRFSTSPRARNKDTGAFCIENTTDATHNFVVVARVRAQGAAADDWYASEPRVLLEAQDYTIVGFQNGPADGGHQDIWVTTHRIKR